MASGYPGQFPGGLTTGYENIGAVRKTKTGTAGYPGIFPGGLSTGSTNIGAVQKDVAVSPPVTVKNIPTLLLMGLG